SVSSGALAYDFLAQVTKHTTGNESYFKLIFLNSSGGTISETVKKYTLTNWATFSQISLSGNIPSGTSKIRVYGYASGTALKFDNISLSLCYTGVTATVASVCENNLGKITVSAS